jgi:hypothetical protein
MSALSRQLGRSVNFKDLPPALLLYLWQEPVAYAQPEPDGPPGIANECYSPIVAVAAENHRKQNCRNGNSGQHSLLILSAITS